MALYWHEAKVALDIVDDPERVPFVGGDDYIVIRATCNDLMDYDAFTNISYRLNALLDERGASINDATDCDAFEVLARNEDEGALMREAAMRDGHEVRGVSLWDGPVPEGSFEDITSGLRMSTPEYMFYRKANQIPFAEAVRLGNELCGRFSTILTYYKAGDDYDYLKVPRTTTERIRSYLKGAANTKEGKRAHRVLRSVCDEAGTPMGSYLYMRLCLSPSRGGYGFPKPEMSCAVEGERGLLPMPSGPYLAYDMFWPKERVAVQYVGKRLPCEKHLDALQADGVRAVCITDDDVSDTRLFDRAARKLGKFLGTPAPEETKSFKTARKKLCAQIKAPSFANMRITLQDLQTHHRS